MGRLGASFLSFAKYSLNIASYGRNTGASFLHAISSTRSKEIQ